MGKVYDNKTANCWNCKFVRMKEGLTYCAHKPSYGEDREGLECVCKHHVWKKGMKQE